MDLLHRLWAGLFIPQDSIFFRARGERAHPAFELLDALSVLVAADGLVLDL
jgi:hypothetical protein